MLKNQIELGSEYVVRLHGNFTVVRIFSVNQYGGWNALNLKTNREVRIKSAAKLRRKYTGSSSELKFQDAV
jgi:hypothetical protein